MSDNTKTIRPSAPALPATVNDLIAQRKTLRSRSLNDDVEECHLKLWQDEDYRRLFLPIWREETVEGSFMADDVVAATKVRDYAAENKLTIAANAKLAAIVRSLHVVCNRYQMNRRFRRDMVGGEKVRGTREDDFGSEDREAA